MKVCTKCGVTLPIANFKRDSSRKGGRYPSCSLCVSAQFKNSYWSNPEKFRARTKAWTQNNPDKKKAARADDYARNSGRYKRKAGEWARKHPARRLAYKNKATQRVAAHYVRNLLRNDSAGYLRGLPIPDSLIELKTTIIKAKRLCKKLKQSKSSETRSSNTLP